ncbi:MAG: aldo/keto reductase [Chloroflexota bacterium]|nr:aldo/keto reductase [Chloroflexota bacterium]
MELRPLGTTGLAVSPIGLGLAALGRPGYITLGRDRDLGPARGVDALRARAHEVLDAAWAAGVRYVDVARSYGRAEEFVASWLRTRGCRPGELTVGSKWGYTYTADWRIDAETHEVKDHSPATFRRQFAESRSIIGDWLRLYQVHSATLESGILDDRTALAELATLRDAGIVVGLTLSGPGQADTVRRALEVVVEGVNPFRCVQATWNLLEPSVGPALEEAHRAGWGVIVKEAVANGRLTPRGEAGRREPLRTIAAERGASTDAVAIAAALARPWADVVLSGAATVDQLHHNLRALELRLEPAELDALAALAEAPPVYWATRGRLAWT